MSRLILIATVLFGLFIAWIVYLADTGQDSIFFEVVKVLPLGDKLGHFVLFGLLALGANLALKHMGIRWGRWLVPAGALVVFVLAAAEELSQMFVSGRTCDITDLLADMAGIVVFTMAGLFLVARKRGKRGGNA